MNRKPFIDGSSFHEGFSVWLTMWLRLLLGSLLFSLIIYVVAICLYVSHIDKEFEKVGLTKGSFRQYLINRYVYGSIGLNIKIRKAFKVNENKRLRGRNWRRFNQELEEYLLRVNGGKYSDMIPNSVSKVKKFGIVCGIISVCCSVLYIVLFSVLGGRLRREEFVRGARVLSGREFWAGVGRVGMRRLGVRIGGVVFPRGLELMHVMCYGTTGSGKSNLTGQWIEGVMGRKGRLGVLDRLVIYDVKGEFTAKFYREGDVLFYPFDERSVGWSFFNEIWDYADLEIYSKKLFAVPDRRNEYWYNAAKDVFRMILVYLWLTKARRGERVKNGDIADFVSLPLQQLVAILGQFPRQEQAALKHINRMDSNQAANIISILVERTSFFKYLVGMDGDFSFRWFVRDRGEERNMFLLNLSKYSTLFRPIMSFVIDVMIAEVLSRGDLEDLDSERVFFVIDELNSLFMMESLVDFVTQARIKGGALWATAQGPFKVVLYRLKNPEGRFKIGRKKRL